MNVKKMFLKYFLQVPKSRRGDIYRNHVPKMHPGEKAVVREFEERMERWRRDFRIRARVQCFLCSYSASKVRFKSLQFGSKWWQEVHQVL